jgi:multidrug efflux pump subunit AcrA (membrane-fusion protein)
VADRDVLGLAVGTPARVWLDARPNQSIKAHVSQVASAASVTSGTFEVEVRVDDGEAPLPLPSGLSAKVEIARTAAAGSVVPVSALAFGDGRSACVFTVDSGAAKRVPVHVAFFEGDQAALDESLGEGAHVATVGSGSLVDGALVRVVTP